MCLNSPQVKEKGWRLQRAAVTPQLKAQFWWLGLSAGASGVWSLLEVWAAPQALRCTQTCTITAAAVIAALCSEQSSPLVISARWLFTSPCPWGKLRHAEMCGLLRANKLGSWAGLKTTLPSNYQAIFDWEIMGEFKNSARECILETCRSWKGNTPRHPGSREPKEPRPHLWVFFRNKGIALLYTHPCTLN